MKNYIIVTYLRNTVTRTLRGKKKLTAEVALTKHNIANNRQATIETPHAPLTAQDSI